MDGKLPYNEGEDDTEREKTCELCHVQEGKNVPIFIYFADRNPTNSRADNRIELCGSCFKIFVRANPDGISRERGLFDFCLNRGLYPPEPNQEEAQ